MKEIAVVDQSVCVACGVCVKTCSKEAISIWKGCYAEVNEEKCVGCGLCGKACPAGCMSTKERGMGR